MTTPEKAKGATELFESLKADCKKAGTNLTEVCRELGIPRQTVEQWKHSTPRTLEIYLNIKSSIQKKLENA